MKITVSTGKRCRIFHRWSLKMSTGVNSYYECKDCKTRKVEASDGVYQPLDSDWLNFKDKEEASK